jgi:hypothetical protein
MANQMRLQPRDLRTVELHQNQFGIYARRNAILINMLVCHAIAPRVQTGKTRPWC